ncbi:MAG: response regulator transcription factor [Aggregatilineales bacterium]
MSQRILIADDHKLFRQGLIGLMRARKDRVTVVGQASTGREAIQLTARLQPDVVLMDIQMPDMDGLEALAVIRAQFPHIAVIMLTASEDDADLARAIRLGAAGYLLKNLEADELFELLAGIEKGEPAVTKAMAARLMKLLTTSPANLPASKAQDGPQLTERELEVLQAVVKGYSNPQIAELLCISVNTVKVHLRNILEKLHVENRAQAAVCAIKCGLIAEQDRL